MKYWHNFQNKHIVFFLLLFTTISLTLHLIKIDFPCLNSDEAAFAYNAYSISETGKDEYGKTMPVRFKSFGENKLPVTIYSIVPAVKMFGLNDISSRLPFIAIGILAPLIFYCLAMTMFNNKNIALIASFFTAFSPWIQIMSRHIHENIIIFLLASTLLIFLAKLQKEFRWKYIIMIAVINLVGLFTYHIGKTLYVYSLIILLFILFQKKTLSRSFIWKSLIICLLPIVIFLWTEISQPTNRINNLLFTTNAGFSLKIEEQRLEHDVRLIHNKVSQAVLTLSNKYLTYFSPEFLVIKGDNNKRFGFEGVSPITPVEFVLFFAGIYYIFKRKEENRLLLLTFLLMAPVSAAVSWQDYSVTRSFLMIIPLLLFASYGSFHFVKEIKGKNFQLGLISLMILSYVFFQYFSWDNYYYHYQKKKDTAFAWQCGYKELMSEIRKDYPDTDKIYITKRHGQPYIFSLFYLLYPPGNYQKQAMLSKLGEYGFGEVEKYDKFVFKFKKPVLGENAVYVGYPEEFAGTGISENEVRKISHNGYDIFWIYRFPTIAK